MVTFHKVLISTAIAFCVFFAGWGWREYERSGTAVSLASTVAFAVFAVGFAVYLSQLKRFLNR